MDREKRYSYIQDSINDQITIRGKRESFISDSIIADSVFKFKEKKRIVVSQLMKYTVFPFDKLIKCAEMDSVASQLYKNGQTIKARKLSDQSSAIIRQLLSVGTTYTICALKEGRFFGVRPFENEYYQIYFEHKFPFELYLFSIQKNTSIKTPDNILEKIEGAQNGSKIQMVVQIVNRDHVVNNNTNIVQLRASACNDLKVTLECKILSAKIIN